MKITTTVKKSLPALLFIIYLVLPSHAQPSKPSSADEVKGKLKEDISLNVCKDGERLESVKQLFRKMGAAEGDIKIEKIKNVENLIVFKKGVTDETVVLGAHYDKVAAGCGAIDNWTGIVILANIYRAIKDLKSQKNYVFAAFGKEELGMLGSKEMAQAIPKEKRVTYCAMVNFDSFGLSYPQAMTNISDKKLIDLAKETSEGLKLPFAQANIGSASSDSEPFRSHKIPAITIHGMSDKWQDYLHDAKDKIENINLTSVYLGYIFAVNYVAKIDARECGAFRK